MDWTDYSALACTSSKLESYFYSLSTVPMFLHMLGNTVAMFLHMLGNRVLCY